MEGRRRKVEGFTLIELLMIIVIVAAFVVVATPALENVPVTRAQFTINKVQSDVRYAQKLAMATQARTRIVFDTGAESYTIERETSPATWASVTHPATKAAFTVQFGSDEYDGVDITQADFDGAATLIFDSIGTPENSSDTDLAATGVVTLNGAYQLQILPETGKAAVVTL